MSLDTLIPNPALYIREMAKPLIDKLFFLDKVEATLYVDFGCADGMLLAALRMLSPGTKCIGYDESPAMVDGARKEHPGIGFTGDWAEVRSAVLAENATGGRTCLILSSVIHEVYSYLKGDEVAAFWRRVWGGDGEPGFDCVAIRDMMVSRATSRPADPLAVARVRQIHDPDRVAQWERQWGSLTENWSLVHFLLTYRYSDNWSRELRENYLPQPVEDFIRLVPRAYVPVYVEHFVPPFLRRQVRLDFGIELADPTHLKVIYERG